MTSEFCSLEIQTWLACFAHQSPAGTSFIHCSSISYSFLLPLNELCLQDITCISNILTTGLQIPQHFLE